MAADDLYLPRPIALLTNHNRDIMRLAIELHIDDDVPAAIATAMAIGFVLGDQPDFRSLTAFLGGHYDPAWNLDAGSRVEIWNSLVASVKDAKARARKD